MAAAAIAPAQTSKILHQSAPRPDPHCPAASDISGLLSDASIALQQANYNTVVETLQPVSAFRCDARISLLLAAALESKSDLADAEQTLQQAHSAWPANTAIATSLARQYLGSGDIKEALRALQDFKGTNQTPWQEMQLGVTVFLAAHELVKAKTLAELAWRVYPSLQSLLLFANALQLEGRYKDVIALLEKERAANQDSAPFLVTLAESEYDAAIYDRARADAERAITLDKNLYAAHYLFGNILLKGGDAAAAAGEYQVATKLEPDQPRTYYYLALALRAQHNEKDEEGVLARAIALDDHYALAHCEMGRILLNGNRLSDAVAQLNLAVEDNASSEQAYYLLSRAYDRLGDKDKAEQMAKRLAAVRRENHHGSAPPQAFSPN